MSICSATFLLLCTRKRACYLLRLFKSLKGAALTNFCPISVLPVMSKPLERIVYDQLMDHINNFDLLSISQSTWISTWVLYT